MPEKSPIQTDTIMCRPKHIKIEFCAWFQTSELIKTDPFRPKPYTLLITTAKHLSQMYMDGYMNGPSPVLNWQHYTHFNSIKSPLNKVYT